MNKVYIERPDGVVSLSSLAQPGVRLLTSRNEHFILFKNRQLKLTSINGIDVSKCTHEVLQVMIRQEENNLTRIHGKLVELQ